MAYIIQHISWSQPIIPNKLNDGLIWRGTIDSKSKDQIAQEHGRVMLECYIDPMLLVRLLQRQIVVHQKICLKMKFCLMRRILRAAILAKYCVEVHFKKRMPPIPFIQMA